MGHENEDRKKHLQLYNVDVASAIHSAKQYNMLHSLYYLQLEQKTLATQQDKMAKKS